MSKALDSNEFEGCIYNLPDSCGYVFCHDNGDVELLDEDYTINKFLTSLAAKTLIEILVKNHFWPADKPQE